MDLNHFFDGDTEVLPRLDIPPKALAPHQPLGEKSSHSAQRENISSLTIVMAQITNAANKTINSYDPPIKTSEETSTSLGEVKPIPVSQERVTYCVRTIQALGEQGNLQALEQIHEEVEAQRTRLGLKPVELVGQVRALVDEVHLVPQSIEASPPSHPQAVRTEQDDHSLETRNNLPAWFLDLKAKLESGAIPRYAGKWHDGDPVEFLLSHYKEAVDARILTQAHLRALDRKLFDSLSITLRRDGKKLASILPAATIFFHKSVA